VNESVKEAALQAYHDVAARHYGFTDAELDFIIHYDIKVRMGRDAEAGDESDEDA